MTRFEQLADEVYQTTTVAHFVTDCSARGYQTGEDTDIGILGWY